MRFFYNIASGLRRTCWFLFRPKTTGVKCLIECDDKYLFVIHSYGSRIYNWNLPGGGVKKNENLESAIKREVKEELGITLHKIIKIKEYTSNVEHKVDTVHCYYAKIEKLDFLLNTNELSKAEWFPKKMLPENISRSIKEILSVISN